MYNSVFLSLCDISCWLVKLRNTHIDFAESFTCEINALKDASQVALWRFRCKMDHSSICNRPSVELFNQTSEFKVKLRGGWETPRGEFEWTSWERNLGYVLPLLFFFLQFFSPAWEGCQSACDLTRCVCIIPGTTRPAVAGVSQAPLISLLLPFFFFPPWQPLGYF